MDEDLPRYSSKFNQLVYENVHMIINLDKAYLSDSRVTNISKSFTNKMAAKASWYRYGTKLRHCHPIYIYIYIYTG